MYLVCGGKGEGCYAMKQRRPGDIIFQLSHWSRHEYLMLSLAQFFPRHDDKLVSDWKRHLRSWRVALFLGGEGGEGGRRREDIGGKLIHVII